MPRRKQSVYWCKHQQTELVENDPVKGIELRRCIECEHLLSYKLVKVLMREWIDTPTSPDQPPSDTA